MFTFRNITQKVLALDVNLAVLISGGKCVLLNSMSPRSKIENANIFFSHKSRKLSAQYNE